jgi:surfeit locus 1 family protein
VGVVAFTQLGMWQLRRAEQKEALQSSFERGQQSTVTLDARNIASLPRYQRVSAAGRFEGERQFLLDNMPSAQGRPGFRVLTPFRLTSGTLILVDRGWIPMGNRRTDLPALSVAETPRVVSGILDELPRPGLRLGDPEQDAATSWPRVLNFPETATLERALGVSIAERILLLDPSESEGFERNWQARTNFGPERHIGYAVQWFAFALVAVVIYLLLSFKRDALDRAPAQSPEP